MNLDGLTYRQMLEGAYKCLAGDRVLPATAEARLAACIDCPHSRLGLYQLGACLQCDKCKCLLGFVGPGSMVRLRLLRDDQPLEKRTRAALNPICKVTVRGEKCPDDRWPQGIDVLNEEPTADRII